MKKNIAVIPGDGIGPEVIKETLQVLNAIAAIYGHEFEYIYCLMGACAIDATGNPLPDKTIAACMDVDAVLLGAIGDPKYDNDPSAKIRPEQGLLKLRSSLELYANIRPINIFPSLTHLSPMKESKLCNVDFVIFRELTGGIYFGRKEVDVQKTKAEDTCTYTREEIERIAHLAFKYATKRKNKLTLVDKANVLETSRLWRHTVQHVAKLYENVQVEYMFVDNAAMQLIQNPQQFDVVLTENMFGDILSDEASVLSGSIGLLPSASIGNGRALFEPIHGSYPQAAGKDIANPLGAIVSASMMLDYLGMDVEAAAIRNAVAWSVKAGYVTQDINPVHFCSTSRVGQVISTYLQESDREFFASENMLLGQSTII